MYRFALVALLAAAPVAAQQAQAPAQNQAPKPISKADYIAEFDKRFDALDTNKDGFTDASELDAARARIFEVQKAMILKEREKAFADLDTNKDGQLSLVEFNAAAKAHTMPAANSADAIAKVDTNKDGKVSREESRAPALAQFTRVDTDKDNVLSVAEMQAASRRAPAQQPAGR